MVSNSYCESNRVMALLCLTLPLLILITYRTIPAQQKAEASAQSDASSTRIDPPILTATVTDKHGQYIVGQKQSAFAVYDNKIPQKILFLDDKDVPLSVGILFDASKSMFGVAPQWTKEAQWVSKAKAAVSHFTELSHQSNEYFILGFNQRVELLSDWTHDQTAIINSLNKVSSPKEGTLLYDALYLGLEKLKSSRHGKRVILLFSDGEDVRSEQKLKTVRRLLSEFGVLVYAVGLLSENAANWRPLPTVMDELCSDSGGIALYPKSAEEMNLAIERIAMELRNQYSISYESSNINADGAWHSIKVQVKSPLKGSNNEQLLVRTRKGYFAAKNLQ